MFDKVIVSMKIPGGFFITFEGIEGCGKSTQAALLASRLTELGYEVTRTREPGGTEIGRRIRAVLLDPDSSGMTGLTELMLYAADRAQHMAEVIEPALLSGGVVVCDRFSDATMAYQGYGRGLDTEVIRTLTGMAARGRRPNLTLLMDLPVEEGLRRAIERNDADGAHKEARFEQEAVEFHDKVRRGYTAIAKAEPDRVRTVAASGTIESIRDSVFNLVESEITRAAGL